MTKLIYSGLFSKDRNQFFPEKQKDSYTKFLILTRKKPTKHKPKNYIIAKVKGKDFYVSSMYPTEIDNLYNIEYHGQKFSLKIEDNVITIK